MFFFFKQKTAYEMRISDWSSDVCSSDLDQGEGAGEVEDLRPARGLPGQVARLDRPRDRSRELPRQRARRARVQLPVGYRQDRPAGGQDRMGYAPADGQRVLQPAGQPAHIPRRDPRSEEHTSELQSLMRISYAVFCLKKKTK